MVKTGELSLGIGGVAGDQIKVRIFQSDHTTFVVKFWDTDAIADAIYGLLRYKPAAKVVVENGRREVSSLSWKDAAKNIATIYRKLYNN